MRRTGTPVAMRSMYRLLTPTGRECMPPAVDLPHRPHPDGNIDSSRHRSSRITPNDGAPAPPSYSKVRIGTASVNSGTTCMVPGEGCFVSTLRQAAGSSYSTTGPPHFRWVSLGRIEFIEMSNPTFSYHLTFANRILNTSL